MNVALYARVSTTEQAMNGYSIDEQTERMHKYAESMNWIVYKEYVDGGFSGSNMNRPQLQALIKDIEKGRVDRVLVFKLDRLSRSQKDTLYLIEDVFLKNGVDFSSMNENFDTASAFGKAMIGILSVFAQLEREQIKERTHIGRTGRAKEGKWHGGGNIPVGYDYKNDELILNEYEAMQIRELHRLYQLGFNYGDILKECDRRGFSHKHGEWTKQRIKLCLQNKLYCGLVTFAGETYQGNHVPIISQETFDKTAEIMATKDYSYCKNTGRSAYLSSLIWCKHCHARFGHFQYTGRGKRYEYYECYSRKKTRKEMVKDWNCKNKIWSMSDLDEVVLDEIRKLALDPSKIKKMQNTDSIKKASVIETEIAKIDGQISKLMDLYSLGGIPVEQLTSKIASLNDKRTALDKTLAEIELPFLSVKNASEMIQSFDDVLKSGDYKEIRLLITELIERIEIDGENIDIYWRFC